MLLGEERQGLSTEIGSGVRLLRDAKHARCVALEALSHVSFLFTNHKQPSEILICNPHFVEPAVFIYTLRSPSTAWALNYTARRS